MTDKIDVLDKGYVRYVAGYEQPDLDVVNAARASFAKESRELTDRDISLIDFLARNGHTCYDRETEVFTSAGWVCWPDLSERHGVAAVSKDGTMAFEVPSAIQRFRYKGEMYRITHRDADLFVTANHRLWASRRGSGGFKPFSLIEAKDAIGKAYRMQATAVFTGGDGGSYDEGFLYGMFLGDGSRQSRSSIKFNLAKERKITALRDTLGRLGIPFHERPKGYTSAGNKVTAISFTAPGDEFSGTSSDKSICEASYAKSLEYRQGLLDGLLESDGSQKRGAYTFSTSSPKLKDSVIRLATLVGRYARENKPQNGLCKVMILSRSVSPRINDPGTRNDAMEQYEGDVFCATVSTGMVLVRRNGRIAVSGNSPFRHAFVTLEVKAPLMVARQWWKYVIGGDHAQDGWNEASRRYLTTETEFYVPKQWRATAANRKQGSDGLAEPEVSCKWAMKFTEHELQSVALYEEAMADGVAPEQARLFLPANAQYTVWRWSTSLQSLCHFLSQRLEDDAQWEIRQYAEAVQELVADRFPHSVKALGVLHDAHQAE